MSGPYEPSGTEGVFCSKDGISVKLYRANKNEVWRRRCGEVVLSLYKTWRGKWICRLEFRQGSFVTSGYDTSNEALSEMIHFTKNVTGTFAHNIVPEEKT